MNICRLGRSKRLAVAANIADILGRDIGTPNLPFVAGRVLDADELGLEGLETAQKPVIISICIWRTERSSLIVADRLIQIIRKLAANRGHIIRVCHGPKSVSKMIADR